MNEQSVQYSEQNEADEETTAAQIGPAPMVERAFRLLDLLSVTEEGLTLSDLARALNMSKGSIHGLLKTLENSGAIEQVEDRRFAPFCSAGHAPPGEQHGRDGVPGQDRAEGRARHRVRGR